MTVRIFCVAGLAVATGCIGNVGEGAAAGDEPGDDVTTPLRPGSGGNGPSGPDGVKPPDVASACKGVTAQAAPAPVRRLTRREYNNAIRDLLADTSNANPSRDFVIDGTLGVFENNAGSPSTVLSTTQYAEAADTLARSAVAKKLTTVAPCATAGGDDTCARAFITSFGKRTYRRPLTDAEVTRLLTVYGVGKSSGGYPNGVRMALQAMLQSPTFVNHIEKGVPATPGATIVALTPYEVASRLSFFLWGSIPDAALFAAADANQLGTPAEIEAQTTRMLTSSRARASLASFFGQWLALDRLDGADRSPTLFPQWTAARKFVRAETDMFINETLWNGDGKLTTMLTAPYSYVNSTLAPLYGVTGVVGDPLVKTDLNPAQRAGLLTQPAMMATTAHFDITSPVHRGLLVRGRFLCQDTPSPPPDVDVEVPKPDPKLTTRERFAKHQAEPYCAGCHKLMDPIGLGFENYDPIGRFRTTENGKAVDARGEIVASADVDGPFTGAIELSSKLAKSGQVRQCLTETWLAYATATLTADLGCTVARLTVDFNTAGTDFRKLIVAITRSDAFRNRRALSKEVCQ